VENNIDKITEESEKNPNKALIRSYLLAIASLVSVIVYFNRQLNSKDEEKVAAVKEQRLTDVEDITFWKQKFDAKSKQYDDCNTTIIARTDQNAIRDKERLDFLEESFQKSIMSRKKQAVSIKKLADAIPTVKTPIINSTNQNNEN